MLMIHCVAFKNVAQTVDLLRNCLDDVKKWLYANKLKHDLDLNEFNIFGSKMQCEKLNKFNSPQSACLVITSLQLRQPGIFCEV